MLGESIVILRNMQRLNAFIDESTQKRVPLGCVGFVPLASQLLVGDAVNAGLATPEHLKSTTFTTGDRKIGVSVVGGKC